MNFYSKFFWKKKRFNWVINNEYPGGRKWKGILRLKKNGGGELIRVFSDQNFSDYEGE